MITKDFHQTKDFPLIKGKSYVIMLLRVCFGPKIVREHGRGRDGGPANRT
jgi:hypothetical protein